MCWPLEGKEGAEAVEHGTGMELRESEGPDNCATSKLEEITAEGPLHSPDPQQGSKFEGLALMHLFLNAPWQTSLTQNEPSWCFYVPCPGTPKTRKLQGKKKPKSTTLLKMTAPSRKKLGERTHNICPF